MVSKETTENCKCLENQENWICLNATYSPPFKKLQATHKLLLFRKLRLVTIQNCWVFYFILSINILPKNTKQKGIQKGKWEANRIYRMKTRSPVLEIAFGKVLGVLRHYWEMGCARAGIRKNVFSLVRWTGFACFLAGFNCFGSE